MVHYIKRFTIMILLLTLVACMQTIDEANLSKNDNQAEESAAAEASENNNEQTQIENPDQLSPLTVHYIDVGQADATLFEWEDEDESYTMLYDTGDWKRTDTIEHLQSQNISHINLIIISHPDADHIGQLSKVIETFEVDEVWMSGNESSSKTFQQALNAILDNDVDYDEPRRGDIYDIGALSIHVLHPNKITGLPNEESLSMNVTYGDISLMFTGDAGKKEEKEMIHDNDHLETDVLQLGHHGSNTSSDPAFIQTVDPEIAIYSAGKDNSYGHPHDEVLSLLNKEDIHIYGTDIHGTIVIKTDGTTYDVETETDGSLNMTNNDLSKEDDKKEEENKEKGDSCIDINQASRDELQQIIHLGEKRAEEVIDKRPFESIDELKAIDGIGKARLSDIKEENLACVGG